MGVGEGRGRRETNMKKHFIFLIGHPLPSPPHSHTNSFPASEARRSSSASSQRVSNWILILINREKKRRRLPKVFAEFAQTSATGWGKEKKGKKKEEWYYYSREARCFVCFCFVSFRFVKGYEFFSGGEMGGWVGGWAVVEDCERLLGCEGCCNRRR